MARPAAPEGTAPGLSVMNAKEGIIYEDPFKTDTVRCGCHAGLRSARRLRRRGFLVHGVLGKPGALPDDGTNSPDALADEVDALLEANPISNQFEIAAMNIEYDFGLKAEDVASYKGVKSNDNGDAGLVLVIEPAEGKAEEIVEALKAYQQDQVAFYGNYAEFAAAQANVENAVIANSADRVVMVIASNACTEDLTDAVNDVLLK